VLPGDKVARLSGARVLYRDGLPMATLVAGQVELVGQLDADEEHTARRLLLREHETAVWAELPAPDQSAPRQVH
jgi:ATP-dependent Lhr-like helicase